MKPLLLFLVFILCTLFSSAQEMDCYGGRYKEKVFDDADFHDEVVYGRKLTSTNKWQDLAYDVYLPKDDTMTNRPVIMLAHGGGFIDILDQKSPDIVKLASEMVARGYVVFSVEYREEADVLSLFSEENMVKAVGRGLIDIRDATCYIMDTTLNHNNPYGIDPNRVIIGGVSAGAVAFLHAVFLENIQQMPERYQEWLLEIEPRTNELLENRYCGANVLGLINISGALLDTAWINPEKLDVYPAMMHVHGTNDEIVPYKHAKPFGIQALPKLMGSFHIDRYARRLGLVSELDTYEGHGHVPILGINWSALFGGELLDFIFNQNVTSATVKHMNEFCYNLIDCNEIAVDPQNTLTSIKNVHLGSLMLYPNPSFGELQIDLPATLKEQMELSIVDLTGKLMLTKAVFPGSTSFQIDTKLDVGIYHVILTGDEGIYSTKLLIQ